MLYPLPVVACAGLSATSAHPSRFSLGTATAVIASGRQEVRSPPKIEGWEAQARVAALAQQQGQPDAPPGIEQALSQVRRGLRLG